ncbi:MAG: hypothetical protein H6Q00_2264 [Holophagaceae bacterium]|nr:hypothetical protein [Holophagaceae bacterium]
MYYLLRCASLVLVAALVGCGAIGGREPEGFSTVEWRQVQTGNSELAKAHRWIDQSAARRKQRAMAVEACYQAYAYSRVDPQGILGDMPSRKRYYRMINTTWLPAVALRAQRGEGAFGPLLSQALEDEAQHCWSSRSTVLLRAAAQKVRVL